MNLVNLGATDIQVSELGAGAWQWGDRRFWGYDTHYHESDVRAAMGVICAAGVNFIDTAEAYGFGVAERVLGRTMDGNRPSIVVASKCFPYPWRLSRDSLSKALHNSLRRLNIEQLDLYQMHWPFPPVSIETWMNAMADAVQSKHIRAVGVSNYSAEQTRRAHAALTQRGIPLASNQVKYSLLDRHIERDGTMQACRKLNVTIIAYSPIEQGLLTGKYTPENLPPGFRSRRYNRERVAKAQPLIGLMREVGQAHGGKTPAQVALNWTICKGTVPIPGAKNVIQAQENVGAVGWRLTTEEISALEQASDRAHKS